MRAEMAQRGGGAPVDASTCHRSDWTAAMHVRTTDADMVQRMTGHDDILARLSRLAHSSRRLDQLAGPSNSPSAEPGAEPSGRRLGLALVGVKPGCDQGYLDTVAACAQKLAAARRESASSGPAERVALFEASDSSTTDAWFKVRTHPRSPSRMSHPIHATRPPASCRRAVCRRGCRGCCRLRGSRCTRATRSTRERARASRRRVWPASL